MQNKADKGTLLVSKSLPVINSSSVNRLSSARNNIYCVSSSKKQYIVVVEEIDPNYTLITGFCVDAENQPHFQNKYINRD